MSKLIQIIRKAATLNIKNLRIKGFWIGVAQSIDDRKRGYSKKRFRNLFCYSFGECPCKTCMKESKGKLLRGIGFTWFGIFGFYITFTRNLAKNELIIREKGILPYVVKTGEIRIGKWKHTI